MCIPTVQKTEYLFREITHSEKVFLHQSHSASKNCSSGCQGWGGRLEDGVFRLEVVIWCFGEKGLRQLFNLAVIGAESLIQQI